MIPGQAWTCSKFFIHLTWKFNFKDDNTSLLEKQVL